MAIRGPTGRPEIAREPARADGPREGPQSPTQRLMDFGAAKTPQEAVKLLREILALLGAAGFPVSKAGAPDQQLSSTLKELQKKEGLPQTGQLDQKTFDALDRLGLLPKKDSAAEGIDQKAKSTTTNEARFEVGARLLGSDRGLPRAGNAEAPAGSQKTRSVEQDQTRARVDSNRVDVEVDLKSMLGSLRSAGFVGAGKGKEQLQDAVKKLQRVDGLPTTGNIDAKTAAALERRGVIDPATAQALKEQDPNWIPVPAGEANETKGTPRGDEAQKGQGGDVGNSAGRGTVGGEGTGATAAGSGTTEHGDIGGEADDIGNNYTGDDDDDDDHRGHANVDDDEAGDAFAHWEVSRISEQVETQLQGIVRDDDGKGAATYGWDLRLHRPGIYTARQPAEELLHLVVTAAGPFDPVWQEAVVALNDRLRRYEPSGTPLDLAAIKLALQRARYRT